MRPFRLPRLRRDPSLSSPAEADGPAPGHPGADPGPPPGGGIPGPVALDHDLGGRHNQTRRTDGIVRILIIAFAASMTLNLGLGGALNAVLPLIRPFPVMVQFDTRDNQIVRTQPMEVTASASEAVLEAQLREYVAGRHEVVPDLAEMTRRWGAGSKLARTSSETVYQQVIAENDPVVKQLRQQPFSRRVRIIGVTRLTSSYWRIEFQTTDRLAGSALFADQETTATWVATAYADFRPQRITYDERLLNPTGFTVESYSVDSLKE